MKIHKVETRLCVVSAGVLGYLIGRVATGCDVLYCGLVMIQSENSQYSLGSR